MLTNFLSDNLTVGQLTPNEQLMPHRLLYDFWLGLIFLGLLAAVILWTLNNSRRLRVAIFLLNGVFTVQLLWRRCSSSCAWCRATKVSVTTLLVDGLVIFVTNILIFSLWYWYIDSASTRFLDNDDRPALGFSLSAAAGRLSRL